MNSSRRTALRIQEFKDKSTYAEVRQGLIEIWVEPKDDELVLVVQGRLVWGKVNGDDGVYISQL